MRQKKTNSEKRNYDGLVKNQQKRKLWQQIVGTLVCIVVFCTTYALILPAITISAEVVCGQEAHSHDTYCYAQVTTRSYVCDAVHAHADACYDEAGNLMCGLSDLVVHAHSDSCYNSDGTLNCKLEELAAHAHTDGCYDGEGSLICHLQEVIPHTHGAECFDENGNMICGLLQLEVHAHDGMCTKTSVIQGDLICTIQEHEHTEECYENFPTELRSALMLMSTVASDAGTTVSADILEVVDSVEIEYSDVAYNPDTGAFELSMKLAWSLTGSQLREYEAFHVELPDGMTVPQNLLYDVSTNTGTKYTATDSVKGGVAAFYYWFEKKQDGTYVIHVEYMDEYKNDVADSGTIESYIKFNGTISDDNLQDDGSLSIVWKDGMTTTIPTDSIDYPENETVNYDIHTQKTASYSSTSGQITYTVKVYSDKGTPAPIHVKDELSKNNITLDALQGVTVVDQSGNAVMHTYTSDLGSGSLNMTINDSLGEGEYFLITYVYDIGAITPGQTYYPYNRVEVSAKDEATGEEVTSSSSASVTVSKEMVRKTGSYDSGTGLITWTIVVNPDGDNIAGYTLTDDMMKLARSLTVKVSNVHGNVDNTAGYEIDYQTGTINFTAANGGTNQNTYTVTYTTAHDQTTANTPISNTAVLTDTNHNRVPSGNGTAGVTVPSSGGIDKTGTINNATGILDWNVAVMVPKGGIGAGTVITDKTGYSWGVSTNHWMTQQQIYNLAQTLQGLFPGVDYTLEFGTDGWNWVEYSSAMNDTNIGKYFCWRVTFHEAVTSVANQTVNIPYQTTADLGAASSSEYYVNNVSMGNYSDTVELVYKPPVVKLDRYYQSGTTNISSSDGVVGWFIRITPQEGQTQINLTDTLPDGLTLTKLGIGSNGSSATSFANNFSAGPSGTVTGWDSLTASYQISDKMIEMTITHTSGATLPTSNDVYVYIECMISDLPSPGETQTYYFKNTAEVDNIQVEQTQNVTVTIPERVIKSDGNGNAADTTANYDANNRTLSWQVKIYLDQATTGNIVITDDLPQGLKLTKVGLAQYSWNAKNDSNCYTTNIPGNGSIASTGATFTLSGTKLTVTKTGNNYPAGTYLFLYIEGTYDELTNPEGGSYDFLNKVSVAVGGDLYGEDSQKQTIVVPPPAEKKQVDKNAFWNSGTNQLKYQVLINPEAKDLSDTDTLSVEDVMSYYYGPWWNTVDSVLISSSVKLYEVQRDSQGNVLTNADGTYLLGNEVTSGWSWTFSDNFADVQWGGALNNTISAIVPDEKPLVLTYIYEIKVSNFGEDYNATQTVFEVTNGVTVTGKESYSDNTGSRETWEVSEVEGGAISSGTFTFNKVQEGNYNIVLPGAEFTVYTSVDNQPLTDANGSVITYLSDENGVIRLAYRDGYYQHDVVYYITETKAPNGYDLPESPTKYYFYFQDAENPTYNIPDGAINLNESYGIAYVENRQEAEHTIVIDKTWLDASGNSITPPVNQISFHLIQTDYRGNSEHYFHNTTKDGIQIYQQHSVIWTAPATGTVKLLNVTNPVIHDLLTGDVVPLTESAFAATEGTPYQIVLPDNAVTQISWLYSDNSDSGLLELESRDWSTTIVVPDKDNEGNAYAYTAQEIAVDGYVSEVTVGSDGTISITNRKEQTNSVTVKKEWMNIDPEDQTPVNIQLYQVQDIIHTEYTAYLCFADEDWNPQIGIDSFVKFTTEVKGAGNYSITWNMQDFGFTTTQGIKAFYIDILDPDSFIYNNFDLASASVKVNGTQIELTGQPTLGRSEDNHYTRIRFLNGDVKIVDENQISITENGSLSVDFTLKVKNGGNGTLPALNYPEYAANTGGTLYKEVTLYSENGWQYTWSDLPLTGTDANGNLIYYSYYAVETTKGYDVSYSNTTAQKGGTITVTNSPKTSSDLVVDKVWKDSSGVEIPAPMNSVTFDLYTPYKFYIEQGYWNGDQYSEVHDVYIGSTITVSFNAIEKLFKVHNSGWTGLPSEWTLVKNEKLGECTYTIWENGNSRSETSDVNKYTLTIPVRYADKLTLVYGIGADSIDLSNGQNVTLGIISGTVSITHPNGYESNHSIWNKLGSYTITADDNWTLTIPDIQAGTYKVVEQATGYTVKYAVGGTDTNKDYAVVTPTTGGQGRVTITNSTETTSVTIHKAWRDNGENSGVSRITVTLYQKDQDGNVVELATGFLEKDSSGNWSKVFSGLPVKDAGGRPYSYYIVESPLDGYYTTYTANGTTNADGTKVTLTTSDGTGASLGTITITNEAVTNIGVDKEWAEGTPKTNVVMELYYILSPNGPSNATSGGTLKTYSNGTAYAVTLGEDTSEGWDKTWKNLPRYEFDSQGNVTGYYSYYVREKSNGYKTTYSTLEAMTSGRVTVTNEAVTTDIGVNKEWIGTEGGSVDVSIWQDYTDVRNCTHSFKTVVTAPTCTSYGYTTQLCTVCGLPLRDSYTAPVGHDYGDWVETQAATCGTTGLMTKTCKNCSYALTQTIPATGNHSWGAWAQVTAPTCSATGLESRSCSICGGSQTRVIDATSDHNFQNGTCTNCGAPDPDHDSSTLECNGWWSAHTEGVQITKDKLTITFTSTSRTDSNGEFKNWYTPVWVLYTGNENKVGGDGYLEYWVHRSDNYGWGNNDYYRVKLQNNTYLNTAYNNNLDAAKIKWETDFKNETWKDWETDSLAGQECTIEAYLNDDGYAVVSITYHGGTNTVTLPVKAGTPTYLSLTGENCTLTNITYTITHEYGNWATTTEATCVSDGLQRRDCVNCDHYETKVIAATGIHSYGDWETVTPANCGVAGTKRHDCKNCGHYETDSIPATGEHSYGEWTVVKPATSTTEGLRKRTCSACNHEVTEAIPATGGGSGETVLWSGTFPMSPSWHQYEGNVSFDPSILQEGGSFTIKYSTQTSYSSGLFIYFGHSGGWYYELYKEEYVDRTSGVVVTITYEQLLEKVGSANIGGINSVSFGGYSSTVTEVTWTPGTSAQTFSVSDVAYSTTYLSDGTGSGAALIGTQQVIPGTTTYWKDLPLYKLDENGNIIGYYTYYAVEVGSEGYNATYTYTDSNGNIQKVPDMTGQGIIGGLITVTNSQQYHYELPSTGGSGTTMYTLGGIALLIGAGFVLMYNHKKGRKGAMIP